METLLNKHVMIQISESDLDIEEGKVRNARDFLVYCFSQFWTIHEKNYDTVPAVSPPLRSFIFLSLLNILAFSILDSLILSNSSGFPL
jgi:hypothetical protein